jgi:hypothetical protein
MKGSLSLFNNLPRGARCNWHRILSPACAAPAAPYRKCRKEKAISFKRDPGIFLRIGVVIMFY